MKKSLVFSLIVLFLLIPATLYLGTRMTGQMYYLTSTLVVVETMLPFFISFERRRPQARELVLLSVMCALAIAARVVIQLPNFKPMMGIVMITGIAFGPEAGFLTGAVSALASNFFFSQGPWTPWQMMAYGVGGFLAGLLFHRRLPFPGKRWLQNIFLGAFGYLGILLVVGPLLDSCTLFTVSSRITWRMAATVYGAGLIHNSTHGIATALTLVLLNRPLLNKLNRIRTKYGLLEP